MKTLIIMSVLILSVSCGKLKVDANVDANIPKVEIDPIDVNVNVPDIKPIDVNVSDSTHTVVHKIDLDIFEGICKEEFGYTDNQDDKVELDSCSIDKFNDLLDKLNNKKGDK